MNDFEWIAGGNPDFTWQGRAPGDISNTLHQVDPVDIKLILDARSQNTRSQWNSNMANVSCLRESLSIVHHLVFYKKALN